MVSKEKNLEALNQVGGIFTVQHGLSVGIAGLKLAVMAQPPYVSRPFQSRAENQLQLNLNHNHIVHNETSSSC